MSNLASTSDLELDLNTCIMNYLCSIEGYVEGHPTLAYRI